MGEYDTGIDACTQGLGYSVDPVNTTVASAHLGYAYLERGDLARAIPLLEQSVAQIGEFRFRRLQGRFLTFLGEAYLLRGELEKARELVTQGLALTRDARYQYALGWAQLALGRIAVASGDLAEAEAHLNATLETFGSIDARYMVGRTHLALAELAHARRDPAATTRHLSEAHRLFTLLEVPKYQDRTRRLADTYEVVLAASGQCAEREGTPPPSSPEGGSGEARARRGTSSPRGEETVEEAEADGGGLGRPGRSAAWEGPWD